MQAVVAHAGRRQEWAGRELKLEESSAPAAEERPSDDESLVARTREGDNSAFDELVLRYRRKVTAVASRFFPRPHDAEDLAQEAFVRAYTQLDKLKEGVPFLNWLLRITINLSLDRIRHRKRRPELSESQIRTDETQSIERHLVDSSKRRHARRLEAFEAAALLEQVRSKLAPKDQAILYLLYDEDRDVAEVAEIMGWTKSNVKVRAFRARKFLKQELEALFEQRSAGK